MSGGIKFSAVLSVNPKYAASLGTAVTIGGFVDARYVAEKLRTSV